MEAVVKHALYRPDEAARNENIIDAPIHQHDYIMGSRCVIEVDSHALYGRIRFDREAGVGVAVDNRDSRVVRVVQSPRVSDLHRDVELTQAHVRIHWEWLPDPFNVPRVVVVAVKIPLVLHEWDFGRSRDG